MHTQSKPGPVFEQKLCQDILHQNAHGWINIDLGVCGRNLGLRLQPLVLYHTIFMIGLYDVPWLSYDQNKI